MHLRWPADTSLALLLTAALTITAAIIVEGALLFIFPDPGKMSLLTLATVLLVFAAGARKTTQAQRKH